MSLSSMSRFRLVIFLASIFTLVSPSLSGFPTEENEIDESVGDFASENHTIPIVLWHGMGDTAVGVKFALRFLSEDLPGVFIEALQFGSNPSQDVKSGYFWNVNDQIEIACKRIQSLDALKDGYNAIGLSQGAQFMRGLAQRCPSPPMKNLISLGGQHQGIFGLPHCSAPNTTWCEAIDKLLSRAAYSPWVQQRLVQAEYWHDPYREELYKTNSVFLANINNEHVLNEDYKANLQKLDNLVLVKFNQDTMVEPRESEWFGYYKPGDDKVMMTLQETQLYKEDRIGLKSMESAGKLHFLQVDGNHLQFTKTWFRENIAKPFLVSKFSPGKS